MKRLFVSAALVLLVSTACGTDGPQLSAAQRDYLLGRVDGARTALSAYAPDQARLQLAILREKVTKLRQRGRISNDQAADILAAATSVEANLSLAPTTTTTTTTLPEEDHKGKDRDKHGKDD
jgi:hypothetical protein